MNGEATVWPLSFEQERQWFLEQLAPGDPVYNRPFVLKFMGTLDCDILQRCLNRILLRHDILEARFASDNGVPHLLITPHEDIELKVADFSAQPATETVEAIDRLISQEARRPFDLEKDRLYRFLLIRRSQNEHVLVSVFHHIVFDGWSAQVLLKELALMYSPYLHGSEPVLPDLPLNYTLYSSLQRERLSGNALERHFSYWRNQFTPEPPVLELPLDRPRPALQGHVGGSYPFVFPADVTQSLKTICRTERVTLFMVLLTLFNIVLYRYTSQPDIAVGCLVSGRSQSGTERLIGLFVNTLPIKTTIDDKFTFRELLRKVRATVLEAFSHQEVPYAKLVAELSPARRLNTNPLFQVLFNMHNMPQAAIDVPGLVIEELDLDLGTALVDLCLKTCEHNGTILCTLVYDTALFDAGTMERMAGHLRTIAQGSLADPDQSIFRLPMLTPPERVSLLMASTSASCCQAECIHHSFEEQAERNPEKVALVLEGREMTYNELNRRANQLAHFLREKGLGPEDLAAVCLERSFETIISFLAVLKAGGAYLPLDLSYPAERLSFMLEDSKAGYILVTRATRDAVPGHNARIVCLESEAADIQNQPGLNLAPSSGPSSLAYVMYTSGSTGRPKGVAVMHQGIIRLVKNIDYARLGPDELFLQLTTVAFDVSSFEIYGSLLNGGTLVIMAPEKPSMAMIGKTVQQYAVTSLCITPEMLQALLDECRENVLGLRQILAAGDALPVSLAVRVRAALPDCCLINAYGPTENSVYTTAYTVHDVSTADRSIPIGRPIATDRCYILDRNLELLPVGIIGELYAAGDGIARGYLHNPELTAEKFVTIHLSPEAPERLYRTGDLARYLPDGNIEFIGRADNQVKIRGCRIELGEIESIVCQHPDVRQCIVTASTNREGLKSLIAYVVMKENTLLKQNELRSFIRLKLPDYMVPSLFMAISQVPLTPVGKIDRRALPEPKIAVEAGADAVLPRNPTEEKLAEMWRKLLNLPEVGVTDNFFDLGGHSLLAMMMFADIEKTFNRRLSVSLLFQEDTIEKLAQIIDGNSMFPVSSHLVSIQSNGEGAPLFCIPALGGEAIAFRNLALSLGQSQPVYGLQMVDVEDVGFISIEEIAAKYIQEIFRVQPQGPYMLAGHCSGGTVAYEMAQQLRREGQEVVLLVLFDTKNPVKYPWRMKDRILRGFRFLVNNEQKSRRDYVTSHVKSGWKEIKNRMAPLLGKEVRSELSAQDLCLKAFMKANYKYKPEMYPGKITVFRALGDKLFRDADGDLGWRDYSNKITIYKVPGEHGKIIAQENLPVLIPYLQECLREVHK